MASRVETLQKYVKALSLIKATIELNPNAGVIEICKNANIGHGTPKALVDLGIVERGGADDDFKNRWIGADPDIDMANLVCTHINRVLNGERKTKEPEAEAKPQPFSGMEFRDLMEENNKLLKRNNDLLFSIFSIMQIKVKDEEQPTKEPANGELPLQ